MNKEIIKAMFDEINSYEKEFLPTDSLKSNRDELQKVEKTKSLKRLDIYYMGSHELKEHDIHLEKLLEYDLKHVEYLKLHNINTKSLNSDIINKLIEQNQFKYFDINLIEYSDSIREHSELIENEWFTCEDSEFYRKLNFKIRTLDYVKTLLPKFPHIHFIADDLFVQLLDNKVEIIFVRHVDNMELMTKAYSTKVDFCMLYNDAFYTHNKKEIPQKLFNLSQEYPDTKIYTLLEYTPNRLIINQYDFIDTRGKHQKSYDKVLGECEDIDKNFIQTLMFSLLKREIEAKEFTPTKESLFKLIKCSVAPIRKQAFVYFDQFYPQEAEISKKDIFVAGSLSAYKTSEVKDKLEIIESRVVKKLELADLVVLGNKSKLTTLEMDKPLITSSYFESLLHEIGDKVLANNENSIEKLEELLSSEDESNVEVALNLMIDGGLDEKLIAVVFALFKTHNNSKIKKLAKAVLVKNPHRIIDELMALIGKRNIVNISDEKKIIKLYDELSNIEGFDVELFKQKVVLASGLGAFLCTEDESDLGKEVILKYLDQRALYLFKSKIESSHFLNAINIRDLRCEGGEMIWKMDFIRHLVVSNKEHVVVNAKKLSHLTGLWIFAKSVELYEVCKISKNAFQLEVNSIKHIDKSFFLDAPWVMLKVKDKLDLFSPFISKKTERIDFKTNKLVINDDFCQAIENSNITKIYFDFKELVVETTKCIEKTNIRFETNKNKKKLEEIFPNL